MSARSLTVVAAVVLVVAGGTSGAAHAQRVVVDPDSVQLDTNETPVVGIADAPPGAAARWASSLGAVRDGKLDLAGRRAPGFAIVAAELEGPADAATGAPWRGAALLILVGRGDLPTQTSPRARVTVEIDGESFGPVTADDQGRAIVPVIVTPTIKTATVVAVDRKGRTTRREVALPGGDFPRALVVAPTTLGRGETGVVTVFAIGRGGAWRDPAAAPPVIDLPPGLEAEGEPVAIGEGRWDQKVRAQADLPATRGVTVGARVDGAPAVPAGLALTAPAPPGGADAPARVDVALRLGAFTGGGLGGSAVAVEGGVRVWRFAGAPAQPALAATLGVAYTSGSAGREVQDGLPALEASQWLFLAGARATWFLGRLRLEATGGLGLAAASGRSRHPVDPDRDTALDQTAVLGWLGLGAGFRLGPGVIVVDARWAGADYDGDLTGGDPLGPWLSAGYRIGW